MFCGFVLPLHVQDLGGKMKKAFDLVKLSISEVGNVRTGALKLAAEYEEEGMPGIAEELRGIANSMEFVDRQLNDVCECFDGEPQVLGAAKEKFDEFKKMWDEAGGSKENILV